MIQGKKLRGLYVVIYKQIVIGIEFYRIFVP